MKIMLEVAIHTLWNLGMKKALHYLLSLHVETLQYLVDRDPGTIRSLALFESDAIRDGGFLESPTVIIRTPLSGD